MKICYFSGKEWKMPIKFGIHSFHMITHLNKQKSQLFWKKLGDDVEVVQCPFNVISMLTSPEWVISPGVQCSWVLHWSVNGSWNKIKWINYIFKKVLFYQDTNSRGRKTKKGEGSWPKHKANSAGRVQVCI